MYVYSRIIQQSYQIYIPHIFIIICIFIYNNDIMKNLVAFVVKVIKKIKLLNLTIHYIEDKSKRVLKLYIYISIMFA